MQKRIENKMVAESENKVKKMLIVALSDKDHKALKMRAASEETTISALARKALGLWEK